MLSNSDDYLSALLTEGPPATRCELVRHLPSDDFGPRVLARLRDRDRAVTVRGVAIADAAWTRASRRLQALAGIHGPHAAELLAYGRHEGLAYMVHAHQGGPRLTTILHESEGQLPLPKALPIFAQLLLAVSEAHHHGVVVGGVRPQDVRVLPDEDGDRVHIRNLGLASVLGVPAGHCSATDHPSLYRAPEADVSRSPVSDVFSLGVLFIRMLTGPLTATSSESERHELLHARLHQAMMDDGSLTDGVVTLMLEAVHPDHAERPRTATRLLESLLELVPARELGLPATLALPTDDPGPVWADESRDDIPQPRASRSMTAHQRWERPRTPTPIPRMHPVLSLPLDVPSPEEPTPASVPIVSSAPPAAPAPGHPRPPRVSASTSATAPRLPRGLRGGPRPDPRRVRSVHRLVLGGGLLSATAALALALAVGAPDPQPAPLPTASLTAISAPATAAPATPTAPHHASPIHTSPIHGTVVIDTNPPGILTIDGRHIGATPARTTIPPGRHVVRVEAAGHRTWRSRIDLTPGQEHRVDVSLEPGPS